MNVLEGLTNPGWLSFALLFLVIMAALIWQRQRETRRIQEKFDARQIVIASYGVEYFGLESEPGGPLRSAGALVLVKDGLWYRARFARRELFIPGRAITYIGVTHAHKGRQLHQQAIVVQFLTAEGRQDKAAFRLPLPAQWVALIKATLIGEMPRPRRRRDREPEQAG